MLRFPRRRNSLCLGAGFVGKCGGRGKDQPVSQVAARPIGFRKTVALRRAPHADIFAGSLHFFPFQLDRRATSSRSV